MNIRTRLSVLVFMHLILSLGCIRNEPPALPEDIMSKQEMASLLADIQLLESTLRVNANELNITRDAVNVYRPIFDRHGIKKIQFEKSMAYYSDYPAELEEIYQLVLDELSEREAQHLGVKPESIE